MKDNSVPLQTNFNASGSVRWRTSVCLNLFHWPTGKDSGNGNGDCRYVPAVIVEGFGLIQIFLPDMCVELFEAKVLLGRSKS